MAGIFSKKKSVKDDIKIIAGIVTAFLFVAWLCTPPGNKFAQMCFFGNNTKYFVAKLTKPDEIKEYEFHWKNAVYLVDMKNYKDALKELDKAIQSYPVYMPENKLAQLYRERAKLKFFCEKYRSSLNDFLKVGPLSAQDNLYVAMLFRADGNYREAVKYCNRIINLDSNSHMGYACIANVYSEAGYPQNSVRVYDYFIDKYPNRAKYYVERALYKKATGDIEGSNEDIKTATTLEPSVNVNSSYIEEFMHPKIFKFDKKKL